MEAAMDQQNPTLTWIMNAATASAFLSALIGLVPAATALIALVYYCIQIYESATVQHWIAGRRVQRIARLKAKLLIMESKPAPLPPEIADKL
jgi:hypothetical protein